MDMSSDNLNVTFVVESSLNVLSSWTLVTSEYCSKLLNRLTESHPNARLQIGIITYATADTLPSPVISKCFYAELRLVIKAMSEQYSELGIGQTASGGSRGMSALEGLVAALEVRPPTPLVLQDPIKS
jgi:mediator of RNA polymerase II transcription subunit 25